MKLRYRILRGILIFLAVAISALALTLRYTSDCEPAPTVSGEAETMKAVVYRCYGSPDVLEFADVIKPTPADNEVLVKIHAASVNPLDWHYMRGSPYLMRLGSGIGAPSDTSMGVDFAGTVESVGANVTRFATGNEVFGGRGGAFAEYVTVPEDRALAQKPDNMTFEQSANAPPTPADNEVLVKIHAASVNPLDWHYMRGAPYLMRLGSGIGAPSDTSMGVDFAGTVESVGANVTRFAPGNEVFGGRGGAFAEYVTVPEDRALAQKPDNMTFEQSANAPPTPADNEVLVKIHAASVNPLDWHYMRGAPYLMRLGSGIGAPSDTSMGVDFAGTVEV